MIVSRRHEIDVESVIPGRTGLPIIVAHGKAKIAIFIYPARTLSRVMQPN